MKALVRRVSKMEGPRIRGLDQLEQEALRKLVLQGIDEIAGDDTVDAELRDDAQRIGRRLEEVGWLDDVVEDAERLARHLVVAGIAKPPRIW